MVSTRRSRAIREKERGKATTKGQEKKEEFEGKVYKKQRPLNHTHVFPKKEEQPKTRTTRRAILIF